ncbi:MAG: outer membrane protein assembly factor BamD [Bacteroidales bacterium]|nr:outer membrane protein assembly factor BamD [Bacteroidales bacterium]MCR5192900.1 outer membrane protein assembly factor BamD [Bacteroidales bacterium]
MKKTSYLLFLIIIFSILTSCNNTEKLLKSTDYEAKYNAAVKYYNEERYSPARQLFENLMLYYRGNEHAEDIAWYYAQSLLKSTYYYTASYQFKTFSKRYPYSSRAEEAVFLSAYCKYMDSPSYTLDQTTTKEAITELEQFADRYPQSTHIPEVNEYLDELRNKLMQKDYEIAYGYYNTESYRAAVVALNNFINDYPESPHREEAMYYIIKAGYQYAINSREDKMKERLQQVINNFDKFATTFKNSKYMSDCQAIYTNSKAMLLKIDTPNSK